MTKEKFLKIRSKLSAIKAAQKKKKAAKESAAILARQHAIACTDVPEKHIKLDSDKPLYAHLSDSEFILKMFDDFLDRSPGKQEMTRCMHMLKLSSRKDINESFAYSDEVVRRAHSLFYPATHQETGRQVDFRVAILLTGHLRTFKKTYATIRDKLVKPLAADVFIHTWDTIGLQKMDPVHGPVPDETTITAPSEVCDAMPETKRIAIENNAEFISRSKIRNKNPYVLGMSTNGVWRMLSARPVFIESQLYSVYSAFCSMRNYEEENKIKYDLIIKLRSDMEISGNLPNIELLEPNDIWVASPPNSNHDHPVCFACSKGPHEGLHATDVCDIYAYGGRNSMEQYCLLWESLDAVYDRMCAENAKSILRPNVSYGICGRQIVFSLWANGDSHRLHGFYPERMFRLYLENLHLRPGNLKCKISR